MFECEAINYHLPWWKVTIKWKIWTTVITKRRHENKFLLINYKTRLICRLFLKRRILYTEIFSRENYIYMIALFLIRALSWRDIVIYIYIPVITAMALFVAIHAHGHMAIWYTVIMCSYAWVPRDILWW